METVVVYEATDELMANSVRDLLLQSGITAAIKPLQDSAYGGALRNINAIGIWGAVLVNEPDREKAEELIAGFLGTLGMLEEADLDEQALAATDQEPPA